MADIAESLRVLASWPAVRDACDEVRQACAQLRFHEALRRRIPEAAAESRVRGAQASAELDGARSDVAQVRDVVCGASTWPAESSPVVDTLRGAVQVTAEAVHLSGEVTRAPRRVLARLHLAAAAGLSSSGGVGRPRQAGRPSEEFVDLGPAPDDPAPRLAALVQVVGNDEVPALVTAAVAHAEIALVRPFERGNGLVARALTRSIVVGRGLEGTGVAVVEAGHLQAGSVAYLGSLAAYASGGRDGVELWVAHCARAVLAGVAEGERIADAVRAGRLDPGR